MAKLSTKFPKLHVWKAKSFSLIACAACSTIPLLVNVNPAGADQISYEKSQATVIATKISFLNNQVSYYSEKYDQAQIQLQGLNSQIDLEQTQIIKTRSGISTLRTKLANEAINLYTQGGEISTFSDMLSGTSTDITLRQVYAGAVATSQQSLISQFQIDSQNLLKQQQTVRLERSQVSTSVALASASKQDAQNAMSSAQSQLSSVNSTLARLVQQAQEQAALAQQQRIRQLVLQQQAQQQAQHQAAQPASPQQQPSSPVSYNVPVGSGAATAVRVALEQLGKPYVFGAAGPNAFDCSGLTEYVWAQAGVNLPHSAAAQYDSIPHISLSQLEPGDLVFYFTPIDHVAIYIGNGQVVVADNPSYPVAIRNVYWDGMPVGAGRP